MTYGGGPWHPGPGAGDGHGTRQGAPFAGPPWDPSEPASGRRFTDGNGLWWLLGGVSVVGVLVVVGLVAVFASVVRDLGEDRTRSTSATGTSATPVPLFPTSAPGRPTPPPSGPRTSPRSTTTPSRPAELPRVRTVADLPPASAGLLGESVDIGATPLRYRVFDVFGTTLYHCLFSVNVENLSRTSQNVTMAFRVAGTPEIVWSSDEANEVPAGDVKELVLGWDGDSPEDVGISESQCEGDVELTDLQVTPG